MITSSYKISLQPGVPPVIIPVSKYDVGETMVFNIACSATREELSEGVTAKVIGKKPNNDTFSCATYYSYTENGPNVTCILMEEMTDVSGQVYCEIILTKENGEVRIGSANFIIDVEEAIFEEEISGSGESGGGSVTSTLDDLDALIAGELVNLYDSMAASIGMRCLYNNQGLASIVLPNVKEVENGAISNCNHLSMLDIGSECIFRRGALASNSSLNSLILRSSTMCTADSKNILSSTPIASGNGGIFVPSHLVTEYQSDPIWGEFKIYPISDYPRSTWEEVIVESDPNWRRVFDAEDDGSYRTLFSVGYSIPVKIAGKTYTAQIAAFDADRLPDNSGYAKISWVLKEPYAVDHRINTSKTNSGGYSSSWLNRYLSSDEFLNGFSYSMRHKLVEVRKSASCWVSPSTVMDFRFNCKVCIPSIREVAAPGSYTNGETGGPSYSDLFINLPPKDKIWWLRSMPASAANSTDFRCINTRGQGTTKAANETHGIILCFCT